MRKMRKQNRIKLKTFKFDYFKKHEYSLIKPKLKLNTALKQKHTRQ